MTRSAAIWLILLFAIACQAAIAFGIGLPRSGWTVWWGGQIGGALTLFVFGGLIPVIIWACLRFRRSALGGVATAWIALIAIFATMIYYGSVMFR